MRLLVLAGGDDVAVDENGLRRRTRASLGMLAAAATAATLGAVALNIRAATVARCRTPRASCTVLAALVFARVGAERPRCVDDWTVPSAAAQVAVEVLLQLCRANRRRRAEERVESHDNPRGAEATLRAVHGCQALLDWMQLATGRADALDRRHHAPVGRAHWHQAAARIRMGGERCE